MFILVGAAAVISAIGAAVATIAAVIVAAVLAVTSALVAIGAFIWSASVGLVVGVLEGLSIIGTATAVNIMAATGTIHGVGWAIYGTVANFLVAVVAGFKLFLEAIHFKLLLQVHEIAYLLSVDYRRMIDEIYNSLAKFSRAIGLGSQVALLALRNARNIVLDASTMMGRNYDLAEVAWLSTMNDFLTVVNERAEFLAKNPNHLYALLDRLVVKPATNMKGSIVAGLFTTVENALLATEKIVTDVKKLESSIETFVLDLPDFIRKELEPGLKKITEQFDAFIDDIYRPNITQASKVLGILSERMDKAKDELGSIVDRLKKPGDLLLGIDSLADIDREEQEGKIFEVANRPIVKSAKVIADDVEKDHKGLLKLLEVMMKPIEMMPYEVFESVTPVKEEIGKIGKEKTWYVGDY